MSLLQVGDVPALGWACPREQKSENSNNFLSLVTHLGKFCGPWAHMALLGALLALFGAIWSFLVSLAALLRGVSLSG